MTAVMFALAVTAVAVIGAALFAAGAAVGYGIARRRYCKRRKSPDLIPAPPRIRSHDAPERPATVVYNVRQVEFVPMPLGRKEDAP